MIEQDHKWSAPAGGASTTQRITRKNILSRWFDHSMLDFLHRPTPKQKKIWGAKNEHSNIITHGRKLY